MSMRLGVCDETLGRDALQAITRELCRDLGQETDLSPSLAEEAAPAGAKGDPVTLGTIVLGFITSKAAVALLNVFRAYFQRSSSLKFELARPDGETLRISEENVRASQVDQTLELLRRFMEKDK